MAQRDQARANQKLANAATEAVASATTVGAKTAEATANTAAAATGAASSVASITYVGPIMAVASVASVLAALANLPKFSKGGIMGGSSRVGDMNLARLNSGEMILTTAQQSGLWNAIQRGDFGRNGSVPEIKLKVEGKDIVGSIKNYQQYLSRR